MSKILVIDDDVLVLDLLEEFLVRNGFGVVRALNGREGITLLGEDKAIDLVILDRKMPIIDGLVFVRTIQESGRILPVILMTGSITKETFFEEVKDFGIEKDAIFTKPLDLYILLDKINEKLSKNTPH